MIRVLLRGGVIVALGLSLSASAALASFDSNVSVTANYGTASLAAPTALGAGAGPCVVATPSVALSWTATTSTWADGYTVLRSLTAGGPYIPAGVVVGRTTTTFTDTPLLFSTTYYYVVKATKLAWLSAASNQAAITTLSALCT